MQIKKVSLSNLKIAFLEGLEVVQMIEEVAIEATVEEMIVVMTDAGRELQQGIVVHVHQEMIGIVVEVATEIVGMTDLTGTIEEEMTEIDVITDVTRVIVIGLQVAVHATRMTMHLKMKPRILKIIGTTARQYKTTNRSEVFCD